MLCVVLTKLRTSIVQACQPRGRTAATSGAAADDCFCLFILHIFCSFLLQACQPCGRTAATSGATAGAAHGRAVCCQGKSESTCCVLCQMSWLNGAAHGCTVMHLPCTYHSFPLHPAFAGGWQPSVAPSAHHARMPECERTTSCVPCQGSRCVCVCALLICCVLCVMLHFVRLVSCVAAFCNIHLLMQ